MLAPPDETTGAPIDVSTIVASFPQRRKPRSIPGAGEAISGSTIPKLSAARRTNLLSEVSTAVSLTETLRWRNCGSSLTSNILYSREEGQDWFLTAPVCVVWVGYSEPGQVTKATPASVPSWLKPQSYWQALLNSARDSCITRFVSAGPPRSTLFTVTDGNGYQGMQEPNGVIDANSGAVFFMEDYFTVAVGFLVNIGFSDWLRSDVARRP
jgi:hypothetical protein